jgi:alpha-beta hydrolase superfamily lysophospholipase
LVGQVKDSSSNKPGDGGLQVILVGHNIGGGCISYVMECFPNRIAKAIFVAASMVCTGQRAFDVFAKQVSSFFCFQRTTSRTAAHMTFKNLVLSF